MSSSRSNDCPICLERLTNPQTTPCNHTFCHACLTSHFNASPQPRCPICRREISWREIEPARSRDRSRRGGFSFSGGYSVSVDDNEEEWDEDLDRAIAESLADRFYDSDNGGDMEYGITRHSTAPRTATERTQLSTPGFTFAGSFEYVSSGAASSSTSRFEYDTESSESEDPTDDDDDEDDEEGDDDTISSSDSLSWLSDYERSTSRSRGIRRTIARFLSPSIIQTLVTARRDRRSITEGASFSQSIKDEARSSWNSIKGYVRDIGGGANDRMELQVKERLIRITAWALEDLRRGNQARLLR